MATGNFWDRFRRWRRRRPFWGSLLLLLAGSELFYSANSQLNGLQLHLGPTGFLSYLLPGLLVLCAALCLFTPAQRLFYGIIAVLTALYSFIGLNFGGFVVGMLLGILGGALVIAWGPPRVKPDAELAPLSPDSEHTDTDEYEPASWTDEAPTEAPTEDVEISGHDDRPHQEQLRRATQDAQTQDAHQDAQTRAAPSWNADTQIVPGFAAEEPEPAAGKPGKPGKNPKALAVGMILLAVTATMLVAGSHIPASADDCPKGMPSRSAPATTAAAEKTAAKKAKAARSAPAKPKAAPAKPKATTANPKTSATAKAPASASPVPSASETAGSGNVIVDGINDLIDGVGHLLGVGDDESPAPSTPPTSSPPSPPAPAPTVAPTSASTAAPSDATAPAQTTAPAKTTGPAAPTGPASASPSASSDDIPCLGARVLGKVASADDIPTVAAKASLMETASLTMYDPTYDGVVELPTSSGATIRALKFSMSKAVNKPFSLTTDEPGGAQTVIKSNNLTTDKNVKFYTSEFKGKLFGRIPVIFTPDSPPPLTLRVLWFTDAKIQLNFVHCDTLTGDPLHISEIR